MTTMEDPIATLRANIARNKVRLDKLKDNYAKSPPDKAFPALVGELSGTILSLLEELAARVAQQQQGLEHVAGVVDELLEQPDEGIAPETLALVTGAFAAADAVAAAVAQLPLDEIAKRRIQATIDAYDQAKRQALEALTAIAFEDGGEAEDGDDVGEDGEADAEDDGQGGA